jgi:membrane protease YdiL (CAAX protease family)
MTTPTSPPPVNEASALRGFGPARIAAIAVILASTLITNILAAVLVLAWVSWSQTPWREIGYVRPVSWLRAIAIGVLAGVALKFVVKAVLLPALGADPVNHAYHYITGNPASLPGAIFLVVVSGGWAEETLYRGFAFERLGKLFGSSAAAKAGIVAFTALWFGAAHYGVQGFDGAEQAVITGTVFGTWYALTGRLVPVMIAHAAYDVAAVAIIYWDLESAISHWIFR